MRKKSSNATAVTRLVFDTLSTMQRWQAPLDVYLVSDTVLQVDFGDKTESVQIRVSKVKEIKP